MFYSVLRKSIIDVFFFFNFANTSELLLDWTVSIKHYYRLLNVFIHSFIHSFVVRSSFDSFIHSFIHSFIYFSDYIGGHVDYAVRAIAHHRRKRQAGMLGPDNRHRVPVRKEIRMMSDYEIDRLFRAFNSAKNNRVGHFTEMIHRFFRIPLHFSNTSC